MPYNAGLRGTSLAWRRFPARKKRRTRAAAAELLDALRGPIEPVRQSPVYVLGLLLVALAMVVLPLIYLGLVAALGYGLYYHAIYDAGLFSGSARGGVRGRLVIYLVPLVIGGVLLLFMIKPLFARRAREMSGLALREEDQPLLFAYVKKLAETVGAPNPREIKVDCDVNASAGFRRGFWSLFGRDLTLTIGLPLAAGMRLRELTGVLAHELGHFTQGLAMRLSYVIRSVNFWFARVVYERDAWLEANASESDWRVMIVLQVTRLFVWLTRRVLWALMMAGHFLSCLMMRQMEYDADRYEARVAGSETFAQTSEKLRLLGVAAMGAYSELQHSWRERRLADNLPALIVAKERQLPAELRRQIVADADAERTGLLDTHPCNRDRVRSAQREAAPGVLHTDGPATALFRDFDAVCRTLSFIHYRDSLGEQVDRENLVETEHLAAESSRASEDQDALRGYFGHPIVVSRPILIREFDLPPPPPQPRETLQTLREAHGRIQARLPQIAAAYQRYDEADTHLIGTERAEALCNAKIRFKPADFHLAAATPDGVAERRRQARAVQQETLEIIQAYEQDLHLRLRAALQLLSVPEVAARLKDGEALREEAARLLTAYARLAAVFDGYTEQRRNLAVLFTAAQALETAPDNSTLQAAFRARLGTIAAYLRDRRAELKEEPYPFTHAASNMTIGRYLVEQPFREDDAQAVVTAAMGFSENLTALYFRLLGRLAHIASRVEKLAKLPALQPAAEETGAGEGVKEKTNSIPSEA